VLSMNLLKMKSSDTKTDGSWLAVDESGRHFEVRATGETAAESPLHVGPVLRSTAVEPPTPGPALLRNPALTALVKVGKRRSGNRAAGTKGGRDTHLTGVPMAIGLVRPVRAVLTYSAATTITASQLLIAYTLPLAAFADYTSFAALYSGWRCRKVEIFLVPTVASATLTTTVIAVAPDPDNVSAPGNFAEVTTKAPTVGVFSFSPNLPAVKYTYVVPDVVPYNGYVDTATASVSSGGCVQVASIGVFTAVVAAVVIAEVEFIARI